MKHCLLVALLLIATWPAAADTRQKSKPKETLSLTAVIRPIRYAEGTALPVDVVFKNTGRRRMSFLLLDNDEDPPGYIQARMWDAQGRLVTENATLKDGWWTCLVMSSESFSSRHPYKEGPRDRIRLKPGETYARTVDLARLLAGCDGIRDGVPAGDYRLQFSYGEVVSNVVGISVGK